jgi:hypothetical protein
MGDRVFFFKICVTRCKHGRTGAGDKFCPPIKGEMKNRIIVLATAVPRQTPGCVPGAEPWHHGASGSASPGWIEVQIKASGLRHVRGKGIAWLWYPAW